MLAKSDPILRLSSFLYKQRTYSVCKRKPKLFNVIIYSYNSGTFLIKKKELKILPANLGRWYPWYSSVWNPSWVVLWEPKYCRWPSRRREGSSRPPSSPWAWLTWFFGGWQFSRTWVGAERHAGHLFHGGQPRLQIRPQSLEHRTVWRNNLTGLAPRKVIIFRSVLIERQGRYSPKNPF